MQSSHGHFSRTPTAPNGMLHGLPSPGSHQHHSHYSQRTSSTDAPVQTPTSPHMMRDMMRNGSVESVLICRSQTQAISSTPPPLPPQPPNYNLRGIDILINDMHSVLDPYYADLHSRKEAQMKDNLSKQIDGLLAELEDKKKELRRVREEGNGYMAQKNQCELERDHSESEKRQLANDVVALKQSAEVLRDKRHVLTTCIAVLRKVNAKVKDDRSRRLADASTKISELEADLAVERSANRKLQEDADTAEMAKESAEKTCEEAKSELEAGKCEALKRTRELKELKEKIEQHKTTISCREKRNSELVEGLKQQETTNNTLRTEIVVLKRDNTADRDRVSELNGEISKLKRAKSKAESDLEKEQQRSKLLEDSARDLQTRIDSQYQDIGELSNSVAEKDKIIDGFGISMDEKEKAISFYKKQLQNVASAASEVYTPRKNMVKDGTDMLNSPPSTTRRSLEKNNEPNFEEVESNRRSSASNQSASTTPTANRKDSGPIPTPQSQSRTKISLPLKRAKTQTENQHRQLSFDELPHCAKKPGTEIRSPVVPAFPGVTTAPATPQKRSAASDRNGKSAKRARQWNVDES